MPFVCITETSDGLGASVHETENDAELSLDAETDYENTCVHNISINLFSHIEDVTVRLALITRDARYAEAVLRLTLQSWWDDNNEGDKPALDIPHRAYTERERAIAGLDFIDWPLTPDLIPAGFWDAVTKYWTN